MLTWAVVKDSLAGFEALLDRGADLTALVLRPRVTEGGDRPESIVEFVSKTKNKEFLKAVLQRGFDPDFLAVQKSEQTLLFRAVWESDFEAAAILLDAGADINHLNVERISPIAQAQLLADYRMACFLMERGADLTIKDKWGGDIAAGIKEYGTRGVRPDEKPFFDKVVAELEKRGLITQQEIVEADKPKKSSGSGVRTIVHPPGSEAEKALRELDQAEQEANRRDGLRKP
jgi:hypothetical protein